MVKPTELRKTDLAAGYGNGDKEGGKDGQEGINDQRGSSRESNILKKKEIWKVNTEKSFKTYHRCMTQAKCQSTHLKLVVFGFCSSLSPHLGCIHSVPHGCRLYSVYLSFGEEAECQRGQMTIKQKECVLCLARLGPYGGTAAAQREALCAVMI